MQSSIPDSLAFLQRELSNVQHPSDPLQTHHFRHLDQLLGSFYRFLRHSAGEEPDLPAKPLSYSALTCHADSSRRSGTKAEARRSRKRWARRRDPWTSPNGANPPRLWKPHSRPNPNRPDRGPAATKRSQGTSGGPSTSPKPHLRAKVSLLLSTHVSRRSNAKPEHSALSTASPRPSCQGEALRRSLTALARAFCHVPSLVRWLLCQSRERRLASNPAHPMASTVSVAGSGTVSEKIVPRPLAPPRLVVPYSVEPMSVRLPRGLAPWGPSKLYRTVGVPPVSGMLKTVP